MVRTKGAPGGCQRLAVKAFCFPIASLFGLVRREAAQTGNHGWMVVAEVRSPDVERFAVERYCARDAALSACSFCQEGETFRRGWMPGAEPRAANIQRVFRARRGLVVRRPFEL